MGKRKERSLVELYKRTAKLSKPRITPILEGNCRIQGPVDESDSEFETDKQACSAGNRSLEESLAEHVENSNAGLKCNNQDEKSTVDLDDGTCDTVSMGKKITGKESDNEYSTGKPVSRDVVEREENSGSVKKRLNANIRRARGNKTRNIDLANTNSDCQQEVGRVKNVSMMEETGKVLECPRAFESNCKGKLPLAGHLSEEDSDKKCSDKLLKVKVTGSGDTLQNSDRDVQVCLDDKDRAESDRQIRSLKQNDGSNIDSRDSVVFDSVETPMGNKAVITSVVMASVADERNQEQNGPSDVPTVGLSMSSDSFKGSVLDMQLPVSEHCVGLSEIHANGNLCNAEDIKKSPVTECPSKLENTDKLTTTHAELLVETNIPIMGEANGLPCTVHAENVTTSGVPCRLHSEKVVTGETDTTAQVQLDSNQGRLLLPDNNIQPRISASSNIETADGYSNHSFLKESLCGTGEELMDLSGEYGPLDISASSSLQNREVMDRLAMEGNISQETVCSAPLSVTPCHSSVTSHASQSVTATKEIEAHSSCQQEEDLVFAGSTDPTEFSSTRKAVTSITEGDNAVIPVLPAVLPQSPADNKDECVKSNFSVGSLATSTIQHPCLEFRKDIDRVPVEVVPENQPEIGEQQVETVSKEWTPVQDPESKLDQDLHMGKASVKIEASETASHSGGSLPCQLSIEKSPSEPFPAEDDVKVCDICGDTGHEEMLAICSMCNDGAEHIYCMQTMLDEVPEGDWLCEGCKLKQNVNLKQVEAPQGLLMASKPACLNSRKQNFYGTARSRLSAKLDKRKLGPERKRAMKGIPSPQVSTKRQAEGLEVGPATKKLVVETNNAHQASLSSNEKLVFSRENSFKALDMGKIKTSLAGSSIGSPPSTILHDSGKSSISCSSPSPKVLAALPSSKSRFASLNGLTSDSLEVIGTSKATSNVSSAGLATLTVKTPLSRKSTDAGLSPRLPSRTSNVQKLSASPRAVKDSNEVGLQAAAARENASSSHAIVGFSKSLNTLTPLKCKANTTSFTVTKPRATSDVQKPNCLKTKEMRPGEVRKHSTELSRSKILSKSQSITRDSVSVGATNLPLSEKLATDDMCVKSSPHQVASSIKDSSNVKKISFGEDSTLAPAPLAQNATKKEHASMRVSGEAYAKLTASPSMLQESIMTNKLHRSDSTGALCTVPDGKSKGQSLFETSCAMSMPVENTFSPSVKEGKKGVCLDNNQLRESYPAEDVKKIDSLEKKLVAEGYPAEEGKKGANPKNAASITWSSSNHLPAVGSTRCYKCKELGHSAQSCTNRISVEVGSDSLRVSTLRASAARSSREISDAISGNLSPEKAAYIKPPKNDGNLEQRLGHFESDQQARKGWSENSSPRQLSASHDVSYADFKTKHSVSSKNAIDLNGNFDVKNSMGHEITISGADFGGVSSSAAEIVTSGISKPSLGIDLPITSKLVSEVTYLECLNQKTNSEQIADCEKYQSHKRVVESEGPFPPSLRDCSKIATTTITPPIVHSEEGTVAAVRGNTSYGLPELADGNDRPMTDLRAVPCQQSTQVETIKAATLPEHDFLWQGGFEVRSKGNAITYFDGIQAHASTCAASKVHDAAKKFASRLQLEEVPRCSSWPLQFQYCCPSDENIALYFFAKDHESYERPYRKLLEHMLKNDFALRGNFNGVELLIFPSNQLPENSQRWNRLLFLWGVFRQRKSSCMESPATRENVHGQPSKRYPFSASNLTGNDSPGVKLSPSMAGFPALEDMDIDTGGQEACVLERILKGPGRANASCHIQSPPAASEEEGPAGDCSNIQILYSVENEKVHSSENVDKKATERLAFIKKPSMRSAAESYQRSNSKNPYTKRVNETDLQLGLETSATHKQPNTRENSVCQDKILSELGFEKAIEAQTCGELANSLVSSQTERNQSKNSGHTPFGSSAVCPSSIERKNNSSDTSRIAYFHSHSPGRRAEIEKERSRLRDFEYGRVIERIRDTESVRLRSKDGDSESRWRPREREREDDRAILNERVDRRVSSRRQEEYSGHEPKHHRDSRHERNWPCPSLSRSPPQLGGRSHSPLRRIINYDREYSRTHSIDSDHTRHLQPSPVRQMCGRNHESISSPKRKSSNDIAVDGKEGHRKLQKSCSEVYGRESQKEEGSSGRRSAEPKLSNLPAFHVTDLNKVADSDTAHEFVRSAVPNRIQPEDPDCHMFFPSDSRMTERLFFPGPEEARRGNEIAKHSHWPIDLSSKLDSPEPSSSIQLLSSVEDNDREPPDLNVPNLELALGGKRSSSKPGVLPLFVQLLDKTSGQLSASPMKSSSTQGSEHGSSLSLSLAFPLSQKDTANTSKEDHTTPGNCCVNTSLRLFGRRVDG